MLGVALFGVIHAATISPIWTSLVGGIPFGLVAGVAIGWAFYELREPTPHVGVIHSLAFGSLLCATLIPMTLFGVIVRATGIHGQDDTWEVVLELLLTFGTAATVGRLISGRWRAALALGTASLATTLAQAGPIPVMNSRRAAALFVALGGCVSCLHDRAWVHCVRSLQIIADVGPTNRWTGATASELLIKLIRFYHGSC